MGASNQDIVGDWLRTHAGEYVTRATLRDACAAACGMTLKYIQGRISGMMTVGEIPWLPVAVARGGAPTGHAVGYALVDSAPDGSIAYGPQPLAAVVLSEASLRAEIDVHFKARAFLDGIQPGQFYVLDDAAIAAGIPRSQARQVFIDARYAAYRGRAISNNRTYLGHPDRIAAMKQERIML